jgi:hypothetical protein
VHDAPARAPEQRCRSVGERYDRKQVHVEHPTPVLFGQVLHGCAHADARIVDQPIEARDPEIRGDAFDNVAHLIAVADVQHDGADITREFGLQTVCVVRATDTSEDRPTVPSKTGRTRPANSR